MIAVVHVVLKALTAGAGRNGALAASTKCGCSSGVQALARAHTWLKCRWPRIYYPQFYFKQTEMEEFDARRTGQVRVSLLTLGQLKKLCALSAVLKNPLHRRL